MTSFDRLGAFAVTTRVREAQHVRRRATEIVRLQVSLQQFDASTQDIEAIGADALAEIVDPLLRSARKTLLVASASACTRRH